MNNTPHPDKFGLHCLGIFILCMATLMYELLLTRIFSVLMWYHFASMAISLALFGLGASALLVYLRPRWFAEEKEQLPGLFALAAGLSTLLLFAVFLLFRADPQFGFRVLSFFHQPFYQPFQQGNVRQSIAMGQIFLLTLLYLATALPFFFSGLTVTLLFRRYHRQIGRLYFFDLLGAGTGCLLIILVLKLVGGITGLLVVGLCFLLGSFFLIPARSRLRTLVPIFALLLLSLTIGNQLGHFADIHFARGRYEPNLLWKSWNSFSRVAVYPAQAEEMGRAWGLSRNYRGPVPEQLGMVVDDTGYTTMYRWQGEETLRFFRQNVINLAYLLRPQAETLIIGPGGGKDVLTAIANGAKRIVPVEINPLIVEAVNKRFADFTGALYERPDVELQIAEGRSYVRRSQEHFDIIQASAVFGRMPPAAGAFTLSENNLYTLEAFQDYWSHLKPAGVLTISRFIFERETLRLVSLGLELLKREGVENPAYHIAVIKERGLANFMLKKSAFSATERAFLREEARKQDYDLVYLPGAAEGDKTFKALIAANGSDDFYRDFPFDITPTNDNRPFFYYMLKPAAFLDLFSFPERSPFEDRAILILRNLLLVTAFLVVVFFALPLFLSRNREADNRLALRRAGYFSCLGLGFMMIEIGLLRRFILFLGHPIYSLAVILFSLLIFSGIGSRLSASKGGDSVFLKRILLALVLLSPVYCYLLPGILTSLVGLSLLLRCLIAMLLLIPLALLLGMPLPLGMALLHRDGRAIPWSWGINGAASVLGTILAVVVAMNFGFNLTILLGSALYLVALFLLPRRAL
ncbi:MAG: hypothetical protein L3J63_00405 [Geopsychrobacter sp.]|nr:hypothetical protein [Geopsychrobacter sp.]